MANLLISIRLLFCFYYIENLSIFYYCICVVIYAFAYDFACIGLTFIQYNLMFAIIYYLTTCNLPITTRQSYKKH